MKLMIVGGGETGLSLANLLGDEFTTTIVEKDEELAKEIANRTHALIVAGDGTDISVLKESGVHEMDAIIATSREDSVNLMICEIAKNEKVPKIITIVNSLKNDELFAKLGVHTVSVVGTNITAIKRTLHQIGSENSLLQWGKVELIQEKVSEKSKLIGNPAKLPSGRICAISREGDMMIPTKDIIINEGDVLLISVMADDVVSVLDYINGK